MKEHIPNGNFEHMIAAKKADLCKDENTKRLIEYVDLVFLQNRMLVGATAGELAQARALMDVPILADINRIKRTIYGDDDDTDEKTGTLNKVNKMFRDWTFSRRIWAVVGVILLMIIGALIGLFVKVISGGL